MESTYVVHERGLCQYTIVEGPNGEPQTIVCVLTVDKKHDERPALSHAWHRYVHVIVNVGFTLDAHLT